MTTEDIVDKIIKELEAAGLTHDEMIKVIRLARHKYELRKRMDDMN